MVNYLLINIFKFIGEVEIDDPKAKGGAKGK